MPQASRRRSLLRLVAGCAVVVVALGGCCTGTPCCPTRDDKGRQAAAAELVALDERWSQAAASRDLHRIASFYADDACVYPPGAPAMTGRAEAEKVWASLLGDSSFSLSWSAQHASVADSGELGFTAGPYHATFTTPDGTVLKEEGKFLCVWRRQRDGSWKAAHDMWNANAR